MPSEKVRSNHDELGKITQSFKAEADRTQQMVQSIKSAYDPLRGGDWIGKGATKFFQEMEGDVFPHCKNLKQALDEAAKVTKQVSDIMRQAEQESSNCLQHWEYGN
jgi:WXG100 family type VII secretion target